MHRPDDRLYIVTRADLPVGLASAQAVHAAFAFARDRPALTAPWLADSQWLVLVTVPDESALLALCARAAADMTDHVVWREPDLAGEATAVTLAPGGMARKLCANLSLLGKEPAVT
jgi:peptidyl-tRNA hydrolase